MKNYKQLLIAIVLSSGAMLTTSCSDDFLTANPTEKDAVGGAANETTILNDLASAYQILLMDSYANSNYNSIFLMSDLCSDDIYKGGGNAGDQGQLYKMENYNATPAELPSGLWSIYFTGLARCNNTLIACDNAVDVEDVTLKRLRGEALTLRAYYVHLLWKFWGNVPIYDGLLEAPYVTPQLTADEVYAKIMADLDEVISGNYLPMTTTGALLARVNMATAMMLRARVVLYQKDTSRYADITNDMATIIKNKDYDLMNSFGDIWTDENEFCKESIFESNQYPEGRTWGGAWSGYGTNYPAFISPSDLAVASDAPFGTPKGGWAFGPVRTATWNMYETGDTRREGSINDFNDLTKYTYTTRFQNTGYFMAKYCARVGYNQVTSGDNDLNYCNNMRIFRFAETLLNYAELVKMDGQAEQQGVSAQDCLDRIRDRAFGDANHRIEATEANIKSERRKEFMGEGLRYWDLIRWGDAATVLTEDDNVFQIHRAWTESKKYLPIPESEINKTVGTAYPLVQNPY
ncbi:RagB/SusD family nutrient uptake outer membrane protein [uncultured Bacteroides sp.]|uniref:RagB/SusD family nutrient uptake outer membrane protein n=1 Tax=uncultured Bacteroides sp. TaxID=162156 RepID=UPI002AA668B0|nr:RagB/SusD family nutrient uptake outer membrane protein [uncultured Bacteroides sp.]